MTKPMIVAAALALVVAAVTIATASINYNSPADAVALTFAVTPGSETPVRATKGDRLGVRPEIPRIAGVTVVLRDGEAEVTLGGQYNFKNRNRFRARSVLLTELSRIEP